MGRAALYRMPCKRLLDHVSRDAPWRPYRKRTARASFFQDAGIFDDRKYRGEPEAVSQKPQVAVTSIRHHQTLDFYFSLEKLKVK